MRKIFTMLPFALAVLLFMGCKSSAPKKDSSFAKELEQAQIRHDDRPINEIPFYGNRPKQECDEKFIREVTTKAGSGKKASAKLNEVCLYYFYQGNYPIASRRCNQALLLNPDNADAMANFALISFCRGYKEEAFDLLDKASEIDAENMTLMFSKARIYRAEKDFIGALEVYKRASALGKSKDALGIVYGCWADLLKKMGDYESAKEKEKISNRYFTECGCQDMASRYKQYCEIKCN